jgi:hypothetical protein
VVRTNPQVAVWVSVNQLTPGRSGFAYKLHEPGDYLIIGGGHIKVVLQTVGNRSEGGNCGGYFHFLRARR